jgi:two-component system, response regulator RegA
MSEDSRRVLVIDENQIWVRILARSLLLQGLAVAEAATGRRGLELAEREGADAVVLDLRLPDGPGLVFLPRLRELCPDAAILVCSAHGSIATAMAAARGGAHDFLVKPTTPEQVLAAIRDAFGRGPAPPLPAAGADDDGERAAAAPMTLAWVQWEHIHRVLMETSWNVSAAARRLGIHRQSLQRLLRKRPRLPESEPWSE